MNKTALFLILPLMFIGFTEPEKKANDLERHRLKGKVKSVMETSMIISQTGDATAAGQVTYKKLALYNPDGFMTHATFYLAGGDFSFIEYHFDTAGNQTGFQEYTNDGTLWSDVTYKLDEHGLHTEAVYDWLEKKGYDELREKTDQLYEVLDRNPWDRVIYTYDYRGFPLEEKYLRESDDLLFKFSYRYDIRENKVFMTYYNYKGRTTWETKYKYDRKDELTGSNVFKSNRIAAESVYSYQYDAQGNWIKRTEQRKIHVNILTASLKGGTFEVQRIIEYYP